MTVKKSKFDHSSTGRQDSVKMFVKTLSKETRSHSKWLSQVQAADTLGHMALTRGIGEQGKTGWQVICRDDEFQSYLQAHTSPLFLATLFWAQDP